MVLLAIVLLAIVLQTIVLLAIVLGAIEPGAIEPGTIELLTQIRLAIKLGSRRVVEKESKRNGATLLGEAHPIESLRRVQPGLQACRPHDHGSARTQRVACGVQAVDVGAGVHIQALEVGDGIMLPLAQGLAGMRQRAA